MWSFDADLFTLSLILEDALACFSLAPSPSWEGDCWNNTMFIISTLSANNKFIILCARQEVPCMIQALFKYDDTELDYLAHRRNVGGLLSRDGWQTSHLLFPHLDFVNINVIYYSDMFDHFDVQF